MYMLECIRIIYLLFFSLTDLTYITVTKKKENEQKNNNIYYIQKRKRK